MRSWRSDTDLQVDIETNLRAFDVALERTTINWLYRCLLPLSCAVHSWDFFCYFWGDTEVTANRRLRCIRARHFNEHFCGFEDDQRTKLLAESFDRAFRKLSLGSFCNFYVLDHKRTFGFLLFTNSISSFSAFSSDWQLRPTSPSLSLRVNFHQSTASFPRNHF